MVVIHRSASGKPSIEGFAIPSFVFSIDSKQDGSQSRGYGASRAVLFVYNLDLLVDYPQLHRSILTRNIKQRSIEAPSL